MSSPAGAGNTGCLHHVELWVPDLPRAGANAAGR
jgi:hypothetical protein